MSLWRGVGLKMCKKQELQTEQNKGETKMSLRFRQVHLDFHTSEHIEDIGKKFDKKQFQTALKKGHINSITLFSKCHHGWAYHPSKANEMHPHLDFDLLGNTGGTRDRR